MWVAVFRAPVTRSEAQARMSKADGCEIPYEAMPELPDITAYLRASSAHPGPFSNMCA